jgi:hypothetical protein
VDKLAELDAVVLMLHLHTVREPPEFFMTDEVIAHLCACEFWKVTHIQGFQALYNTSVWTTQLDARNRRVVIRVANLTNANCFSIRYWGKVYLTFNQANGDYVSGHTS